MNVKQLIDGMADRGFSLAFHQGVREMYTGRDYGDTERDYKTDLAHLETILTDEEKIAFGKMEQSYTARRNYAAEYGFKCGIYGAFRQFFGCSDAKDGGFQDLVADDLLMQPIVVTGQHTTSWRRSILWSRSRIWTRF